MASETPESIKARLYALLNLTNPHVPSPMTESNVTLGKPLAMETPVEGGVNTVLPLTAVDASGYTGNANVYYGRVDVSTYFKSPLTLNGESIQSWDDVASAINAVTNTLFTGSDFNVTTWVAEPLPSTQHITVASDSWLYRGGFDLTLTTTQAPLDSVISVTTLNGLTAPAAP